ncbi:MAG: amino acid--tRNA ligase-related protein [Patescibacteria group bacterium]
MRLLTREMVTLVGEEVELTGWVSARRDHGKIIFIDLRDRGGVAQVVFTPKEKELYEAGSRLRPEWVVKIRGKISVRPKGMENEAIPTGKHELVATHLEVISEAETPPFPLDTDGHEIDEEVRLKYRYLDLRRERLHRNIKLRSEFVNRIRQFLFKRDFTEIETPMLTKSTPEGSRDFVVPSRLHPGKFFALPQSPQQYKQLLMVAGFERYFQIARCVRDEDLRADRGFEHSQIDLEMSFVKREEVMAMDEEMITSVVEGMGYTLKEKPFPVIPYTEAIAKYKGDKFDLRTEADKKNNVLAFAWVVDFPFFEKDPAAPSGWAFTHNPFSMPKEEHVEWLKKGERIGEILTTQYDLVCNGYEVGGGSIRAHQPEILKSVFRILGYEDDVIEAQFGHMLTAFKYGAPPHGGIAHGVERLLMILTGEQYLREVQAFPQTSSGRTSVMDAPAALDPKQLKELKLKVKK